MEAKDRWLTNEEKVKLFHDYPCLDPSFEDDYKTEVEMLLEAQDAKSFKAGFDEGVIKATDAAEQTYGAEIDDAKKEGIKEVVEWIQLHATDAMAVKDSDTSQQMSIRAIPDDKWQAKLKEWGLSFSQ